jgi:chromosome segregation ATPase
MAIAWAQAKIADLELRLAQKTSELDFKTGQLEVKTMELGVSSNRITELQTNLDRRTTRGVVSAARIKDLESKLTTRTTEVEQLQRQLYQLQTAEIARLKASSEWASAAAILKAQVTIKESELATGSAKMDQAGIDLLSKALCDQHYQLGKLYYKVDDLSNAETYARKAYDQRLRLLGPENIDTRRTQQQLCKVLRKTGNSIKIRLAASLYRDYWERQTSDEFVLECGHELGCLYQEQGR